MNLRNNFLCFAVTFAFATVGLLTANEKPPGSAAIDAASPVILIRNATILTVSHGTIDKGDILIKDGKIAAVGGTLKAPADAVVIDATGQFVTPGIIDCHSHIAVDGSVNEGSVSVSSMVNIADVLDSDDISIWRDVAGVEHTSDDVSIWRDLAGGVTTANILHGSANS